MIYIYGAIASGKSAYAEDYVCRLGKERVYLALMQVYGEEGRNFALWNVKDQEQGWSNRVKLYC